MKPLKKKNKQESKEIKTYNKIDETELAKALIKHNGQDAYVAELFGITVQAIKKRIKNSENLKLIKEHVHEKKLDFAEGQLLSLMKDKHFPSIKYFLESHGKSRGYGKEAIEQNTNKTGVLLINSLSVTNNNLDPDSWSELARRQKIERDRQTEIEENTIDIKE